MRTLSACGLGLLVALTGAGTAGAGPLREALERELAAVREARELLQAQAALDQEQQSAAWASTVVGHRARESLRRLDAYRVAGDAREAQARVRARAMYKLARGGVSRLYFEGVAAARAGAPRETTADRVAMGRTIRWLVRHDLSELSVHVQAEQRARAQLLASTRELAALSSLQMIHDVERQALAGACVDLDPELESARRARTRARRGRAPNRGERALLAEIVRDRAQLGQRPGQDPLAASTLLRPVRGEVVGAFGTHEDARLGLPMHRNGIELRARRRERVRAVAPGTVALVGSLPGFDDVVVLDHGHGYVSLTARLHKVAVVEGEQLARGAVLGIAAPKSLEDGLGPSVYLELRHGERPIDPAPHLSRPPGERSQLGPVNDDADG